MTGVWCEIWSISNTFWRFDSEKVKLYIFDIYYLTVKKNTAPKKRNETISIYFSTIHNIIKYISILQRNPITKSINHFGYKNNL